jgi:hypothetical protein
MRTAERQGKVRCFDGGDTMTTIVLYCNECRKGMRMIETESIRKINAELKEWMKQHRGCSKTKCKKTQ